MPITKERFADLIAAATDIRDKYLSTVRAFHHLAQRAQIECPAGSTQYELISQIITYCIDPKALIAQSCETIAAEEAWNKATFSRNERAKRYQLRQRQKDPNWQPQRQDLMTKRRHQIKQEEMDEFMNILYKGQSIQQEIGQNTLYEMNQTEDSITQYLTRDEVPQHRLAEWDAKEHEAQEIWNRIEANRQTSDDPQLKMKLGIYNGHAFGAHKAVLQGQMILCKCEMVFDSVESWVQHLKDYDAYSEQQITRPINVPESVRFPEDDPTFALLGGIIQDKEPQK